MPNRLHFDSICPCNISGGNDQAQQLYDKFAEIQELARQFGGGGKGEQTGDKSGSPTEAQVPIVAIAEADTSAIVPDIEAAADSANPVVDIAGNSALANAALSNVVSKINNTTATIKINAQLSGGIPNPTGAAGAKGIDSADEGITAVAELKPEMIIRKNAGVVEYATEPQFVHLSAGDKVLNPADTKKMLRAKKTERFRD